MRGITFLLLWFLPAGPAQSVTPNDIHNRLRSVGTWVDWENTAFDGFTYNASRRNNTITRVGVTWYPSVQAVQRAVQLGCQLLIHHEPLWYDDDRLTETSDPGYITKKQLLDSSLMVTYRSHDFQDLFPQYGVHAQWKQFLGLVGNDVQHYNGYISVSLEAERTVAEWGRTVAEKARQLGQPRVRVIGNPDTRVRRIAYGTGAVAWPRMVWQVLTADLVIATEVQWVEEAQLAKELNRPLIVVDHGVSEIPGVRATCEWMRQQWPSLTWTYIDNALTYEVKMGVATNPLHALDAASGLMPHLLSPQRSDP